MNRLKKRWDISSDWQLLYPVVGTLGLLYSAFKLASLFKLEPDYWTYLITAIIFAALLKVTLMLFNFLETRWKVDQRWKVIRIFIVFAITGSMSLVVTRPVFDFIGLTHDNFDSNGLLLTLYYIIKFFAILPFYTILLVGFGWIFKEYKFFLGFAIKMISRFGFKSLAHRFEEK